jgi:hypothetical protein
MVFVSGYQRFGATYLRPEDGSDTIVITETLVTTYKITRRPNTGQQILQHHDIIKSLQVYPPLIFAVTWN